MTRKLVFPFKSYSSLLLQKTEMYFEFLTEPLTLPLTLSADSEIQGRVVVALLEAEDPSRKG